MRPLLILDLDETLIHAAEEPLTRDASFRCGCYHVYERLFVREFCAACSRHYELAVWTSTSAEYAHCVVAHVLEGVRTAFVWSRERCTRRFDAEAREFYWVKDLRKVRRAGYDLSRTLFVDDTRRMLERNYGNLVLVSGFTGDPLDDELFCCPSTWRGSPDAPTCGPSRSGGGGPPDDAPRGGWTRRATPTRGLSFLRRDRELFETSALLARAGLLGA